MDPDHAFFLKADPDPHQSDASLQRLLFWGAGSGSSPLKSKFRSFFLAAQNGAVEKVLRSLEPKLNCLPEEAGAEITNSGSGSFLLTTEKNHGS